MEDRIYNAFNEYFQDMFSRGDMRFQEALSAHCSFRIGGPADVYALPGSQADFIRLLVFALERELPYFIMGKGSNLLIGDRGIRGLVISTDRLNKITRDENYVSAFAGAKLKDLCDFCCQSGLSGLEFASGIPGSVGGAVFMNAGAYGGEIRDVLYCSKCLSPELESLKSSKALLHLKAADHKFAYRYSALQTMGLIQLSSVFMLKEDDPEAIRLRMDDLDEQRNAKQPMDLPSGGSVFKRPEGYFTGKLIDDCGLRGYRIGDAAISEKHCGFIVNLGAATALEVKTLIKFIQDTIFGRFGVKLEPELRMVGED